MRTTIGTGASTSTIQRAYFALLDPNGHCRWAKKIVGPSFGQGYHVQSYSNSDFVFGGFTSAADFGNGVTTTSGTANHEAYIARYHGFPYPEITVEQAGGGLSNYGNAQDFGNGFTGAPGTTVTFIEVTWERVVVEQPYGGGTPRRFMKLQVVME